MFRAALKLTDLSLKGTNANLRAPAIFCGLLRKSAAKIVCFLKSALPFWEVPKGTCPKRAHEFYIEFHLNFLVVPRISLQFYQDFTRILLEFFQQLLLSRCPLHGCPLGASNHCWGHFSPQVIEWWPSGFPCLLHP